MSKQYSCELCKKSFNQKIDYTRHVNKKAPCISLTDMEQITQTKEEKKDIKTNLINIFKNCLNILRDNEGLTGEKALRNISYLIILKLLEPRFGNEIDIDNYEYDFSSYFEEDVIEANKKRLLLIIRFSNLSNEKDDDIPYLIKLMWDIILSIHPSTKNIFLKGKGFDIQHKSTYKKLIDKLNSLDLSNTEYDVLGNAYEEVIQDIMTGKILGQFFTQPLIKKMMVKLINPQIHPDGKIDTCGDLTMGTAGFLITYLQTILEQAKTKNIKPDWDFIKTEGLYGKELEPDTYQLAVSNMLISSGHMFEGLDRGDSIRDPITRKFDNVLANPPFGIKGLKYDDFQSNLKNEYVPIKTDNAVSLFIQAIIYMLKIGGKCAVVLPDGQDLFSKTNNTLVAIREYLMKTCDLKEIIYLPSGIFTYTSIKTCVFYFIKKREGTEVLETKIKVSKTNKNKETGRDYKFTKTLQTTKVKFYDYNPYEDVKNLLVEVPIEKIVSNSYSLNYAEYMKDEIEEEQYEDGVVVKTLGEVCEIQNGKRIVKGQVETGEYPVLGGGGFTSFYTNEHSREGKTCKISREGMSLHNCVMLLNEKYYLNSQAFTIKSKNESIMINEYLWYYLDNNKEQVFKCGRGTAQKAIDIDEFKSIKIPIPSLDKQQETIKYLDFIYEKAIKTSNEKIAELKELNEYCLKMQKIFSENVVKTLGEVCSIDYGTRIVKGNNTEGEYPVYGSGRAMFSTNTFNREGYNILIGRFALSLECVRFINEKIFLNDSGLSIKPKTDILLHKYIGYYLLHNQSIIYNCARGTAQKNLEMDIFKSIKIPIPSLDKQKEIVEYCEYNDTLIKQLEKEIENNKKQAQQFITGIVKNSKEFKLESNVFQIKSQAQSNTEDDDTILINTEPINEVQDEIIEQVTQPKKIIKATKKRISTSN
jgi:type I restriction-modification system DNA methylase subunit/restriction endonuclease S subunit